MSDNRIFTDQELKEMGTRTLDLVHQAIDAGDKEKAKELATRMYQEFNFLHDGYMFWVTGLQTYIYKNYGIEAVEEAEREAAARMKGHEVTITINLNQGRGKDRIITCDLTYDYIRTDTTR